MASSAAMASSSCRCVSSVCNSEASRASASSKPTAVLHPLAHTWLPLNFLLLLTQSELTLFVFATEPLQKLHFPEADQPVVPDLHLQHFSVVPKMDQSCSAMASSAAMASTSSRCVSSVCKSAASCASASNKPTTRLQSLAHTWLPLNFLLPL